MAEVPMDTPNVWADLGADAEQCKAIIERISNLSHEGLHDLKMGRLMQARDKFLFIFEGMVLLKKLWGI